MFYLLQRDKTFSEERACFYAAEILLGLEYLHQEGVIYRYTVHSNQHSSELYIIVCYNIQHICYMVGIFMCNHITSLRQGLEAGERIDQWRGPRAIDRLWYRQGGLRVQARAHQHPLRHPRLPRYPLHAPQLKCFCVSVLTHITTFGGSHSAGDVGAAELRRGGRLVELRHPHP